MDLMTKNLKKLFKDNAATAPVQAQTPQVQNPNNKKEGETYHHWGLRVCAIADGGCLTLRPYLHNVYNYIHCTGPVSYNYHDLHIQGK